MSLLSDLEIYLKPYHESLIKKGFNYIESENGPGMGAYIIFSNSIIDIMLTNDRNYFFLYIQQCKSSEEYIDLEHLLAIIKCFEDNQDICKLTKKEKIKYWELTCDCNPLPFFLKNVDKITELFKEHNFNNTKQYLKAFYKDRGKWLFH